MTLPTIMHSHTHTHTDTLILPHKYTDTLLSSVSHQLPQAHTYLFSHTHTLMLIVIQRHTFTQNQTYTDTQSWLCTQQVHTCTYVHLNSVTSGHAGPQSWTESHTIIILHPESHRGHVGKPRWMSACTMGYVARSQGIRIFWEVTVLALCFGRRRYLTRLFSI